MKCAWIIELVLKIFVLVKTPMTNNIYDPRGQALRDKYVSLETYYIYYTKIHVDFSE